jgi:hypothetical protein
MSPRRWAAALLLLGAVDWWAAYVKHDGTLSHAARLTFATDTRRGRLTLIACWTALTAWLMPHLCIWPEDRR